MLSLGLIKLSAFCCSPCAVHTAVWNVQGVYKWPWLLMHGMCGCRELAEAAVARRAWSLLRDWGGEGLRQDLALLAIHAAQHGRSTAEDSEERFWEFLLVHYHEATLQSTLQAHH